MSLKALLKEKNITVKELSIIAKMPYATISDLVNGNTELKRMQLGNVLKICKALDLELNDLIKICESKNQSFVIRNRKIYKINKSGRKYICSSTNANLRTLERARNEDFQTFRNNLHHELKNKDELSLALDILKENRIETYYNLKKTLESLYLLSLVDYILNKNKIELPNKYFEFRKVKLKEPFFIGDIISLDRYYKTNKRKEHALNNAIPEFKRHNIIEVDLYDVI